MLSLIKSRWQQVRSALWARPAAFCVLALLAAGGVWLAEPLLPEQRFGWLYRVQLDDVRRLLELVASGMLTVVTVTMSVMMLVLSLVAGQASPRAVPELMADRVIQHALGVFLASFVFALTAAGMLSLDMVGGAGLSLLGGIALVLLVTALVSLLRLIQRGASMMKLNEVIERLQAQAERVLTAFFESERDAAGRAGSADEQEGGTPVAPRLSGYAQLVDEPTLVDACREHSLRVRMLVREGDFVHESAPMMLVQGLDAADDEVRELLCGCVVVGGERSLEQDPLLGFALLAEVGSRALSPGINDPQTALICIDRLCALLARAARVPACRYPPRLLGAGCLTVLRPDFGDMLERGIRPLIRDGAGYAEVQQRLAAGLVELHGLAEAEHRERIAVEGERLLAFAEDGLRYAPDLERVREILEGMGGAQQPSGR